MVDVPQNSILRYSRLKIIKNLRCGKRTRRSSRSALASLRAQELFPHVALVRRRRDRENTPSGINP
jgi:hypothetical protein